MRDLIVFGNGLGKSIDPDYFTLDRGLQQAWEDNDILDEAKRNLITRCLPNGGDEAQLLDDESEEKQNRSSYPTSEGQLGELQRVVSSCDVILDLEREDDEGWLTEHGKEFPGAIRSFIHRSACYFHFFEGSLPDSFVKGLTDYILESRSHIATLNYDDLLYSQFIGTKVFSGYSCMIDGFLGAFSDDNLERARPESQCYYLHLHGSPLFVTRNNGRIVKKSLNEIFHIAGHQSAHLVLTKIDYKPSVIKASPVLSAYWNRLKEAASEVDRITILGYSAEDTHLNLEIKESGKPVRVVERDKQQSIEVSRDLWEEKLGTAPEIIRVPSITDFTAWT